MLFINSQNEIYSGDCQNNDRQLTDDERNLYLKGNGYEVIGGVLTDISDTPEYIAEQEEKEKIIHNDNIYKQIDELDIKRVRALAEPSDHPDGGTWLEFYNSEVQTLRLQIQ